MIDIFIQIELLRIDKILNKFIFHAQYVIYLEDIHIILWTNVFSLLDSFKICFEQSIASIVIWLKFAGDIKYVTLTVKHLTLKDHYIDDSNCLRIHVNLLLRYHKLLFITNDILSQTKRWFIFNGTKKCSVQYFNKIFCPSTKYLLKFRF